MCYLESQSEAVQLEAHLQTIYFLFGKKMKILVPQNRDSHASRPTCLRCSYFHSPSSTSDGAVRTASMSDGSLAIVCKRHWSINIETGLEFHLQKLNSQKIVRPTCWMYCCTLREPSISSNGTESHLFQFWKRSRAYTRALHTERADGFSEKM